MRARDPLIEYLATWSAKNAGYSSWSKLLAVPPQSSAARIFVGVCPAQEEPPALLAGGLTSTLELGGVIMSSISRVDDVEAVYCYV